MRTVARAIFVALSCLTLSGCYVNMHGVQSTSGGTATTTTSSQVVGAASFSGGKLAFSSGQAAPPGAPGGHLRWSGNTTGGAVLVGLVVADLLNYIVGWNQPKPLPEGTKIMHTCSCFKQPVMGNEIRDTSYEIRDIPHPASRIPHL